MLIRLWLVLPLMVLLVPSQAYAYLDPGTGSMLLQIVIGGVAGLAVFGRIFWKKLKAGLFSRDRDPAEPKS